jgi:hypothetical protein
MEYTIKIYEYEKIEDIRSKMPEFFPLPTTQP